MLDDVKIAAFEKAGFRRWTKYGMDRLYVTAKSIGLEVERYNTGNIRSAVMNGETISNSQAKKILADINGAYVDVKTEGRYFGFSIPFVAFTVNAIVSQILYGEVA